MKHFQINEVSANLWDQRNLANSMGDAGPESLKALAVNESNDLFNLNRYLLDKKT